MENLNLAIIKAAAWAWYQHGSGCEGRPMREFNLTRGHRSPRPSRYKLEALRDADRQMTASGSHTFESIDLVLSPCHTNMSLLDSLEIKRISSQLNCILDSSSSISNGNYVIDGRDRTSSESSPENGTIRKKAAWKLNGFWLRHAMGLCGSREEMVKTAAPCSRRRRKHGSVARLANCRP